MGELERLLREVSHLLAQSTWEMTGYGSDVRLFVAEADVAIARAIGQIITADIYKATKEQRDGGSDE